MEKAIYNEKVDIYAAAMIMWFIYMGERPFTDEQVDQYAQQAMRGEATSRPPVDCITWKPFQELIVRAWSTAPKERPCATEVMAGLEDLVGDTSACAPRCVIV
jgi:hypothetical protein